MELDAHSERDLTRASSAGRHGSGDSDAPSTLSLGDRRLLGALADIDDRGLEIAEAIVHQHRQLGGDDPQTGRALLALSRVRDLTKAR